jgi:hypothetical protein
LFGSYWFLFSYLLCNGVGFFCFFFFFLLGEYEYYWCFALITSPNFVEWLMFSIVFSPFFKEFIIIIIIIIIMYSFHRKKMIPLFGFSCLGFALHSHCPFVSLVFFFLCYCENACQVCKLSFHNLINCRGLFWIITI